MLSEIRLEVADAVGIDIGFTQPETVIARYEELFRARSTPDAHEPMGMTSSSGRDA